MFFLISQPLVYLVQVPFNPLGWGIFKYYPDWFVWTLFTFPMGFVGYYMRKEKWWSFCIPVPILAFLGFHYYGFLGEVISYFPNHLLSAIFCAVTMIVYPLFIFKEKKLRIAGLIISIVILAAASIFALNSGGNSYNTTLMTSGGSAGVEFDESYKPYLEDESFGEVSIVYEKNIDTYMVNADFVKTGETKFILEAPDGEKRIFSLVVNRNSYDIEEIKE
ncbi:MAG: hypothetical protein K5756_04905 [Clostridiales bacterium]|nr:hypothetical protein [Clostridiales bacterium]